MQQKTAVRERTEPRIVDTGPLAKDESASLWSGAISFGVIEKELGTKRVKEAIAAIGDYFAPTRPHAPTQCIDGRCCAGHHPLGAKVPGGTAGIAFADAIVRADDITEESAFAVDLAILIGDYRRSGFPVGDHVDDHPHAEGIGCGAVDTMPGALKKMQEPAFAACIGSYLEAVLGEEYDARTTETVIAKAKRLYRHATTYLGNGYATKAKAALEAAGKGTVEMLTGNHREVAIVMNLVPDTTFDRDVFSDQNDGAIQAFDYDVWSLRVDAERLYPGDAAKQREFLAASAMAAVATMMALSDGSTRLLIRR